MLIIELIEINGIQYVRTKSDSNYYITRDGAKYSEAIDPVGTNRVYIELDEVIEEEQVLIDNDNERL
jgi:hypothetical protein